MEKRPASTKDLIDEILCRLNTIQKVKVEEEFDDALYGVHPSMIKLVGEYRIESATTDELCRILSDIPRLI